MTQQFSHSRPKQVIDTVAWARNRARVCGHAVASIDPSGPEVEHL